MSTTNNSNTNDTPKFDAEMAHLYQRVAENHYHETGPWNLMLQAFQKTAVVATETAETTSKDASFRLLDLASGHGEPCTLFATQYPKAQLISTDFSNDMVELAKERTQHLSNVSVEQADMQDLRFDSNSFDCITCSYGFMFPPDKDKAIAEAYRVLKPGGVLIATTWNQLPLMALVGDIMAKVLKLDQRPPPPPLNPMSLSEPGLFSSMLERGGFEQIATKTSSYPFVLAADHDFSFKMVTMLIKDKLNELNEWDTARDAYNGLIHQYAFVDADGNTVIDDNVFQLIVAKKPM
jgi:ubiquinone/menaquinone biosynthesis C-methylase UbiE